ncbi:MAG: triose-phosphate isomerase [Sedimentisphaerales bacterium]|nr:triose-phosphate isomerase [Sedimentisphaerales bacterium]
MRKVFVAGNWKMNLDSAGSRALANGLCQKLADRDLSGTIDMAVCPPFVYLPIVAEALQSGPIALGAQDVYFEPDGAFTGEISVNMLRDVGCRYVIVGHSERRHVLGETDEQINRKLRAVLAGGLKPILCIGELLGEREDGRTEAVIERHLRKGLADVAPAEMERVTVAYEPVWAIGTGRTASPEQAQEAHRFARGILQEMFGPATAQRIRIQYGGSVKPANAAELIRQPDVDGALVGGASLKVNDFWGILDAAAQAG